ncbi:MAG: hypothetical protein RSH78_00340 [Bacilli bacterium]
MDKDNKITSIVVNYDDGSQVVLDKGMATYLDGINPTNGAHTYTSLLCNMSGIELIDMSYALSALAKKEQEDE